MGRLWKFSWPASWFFPPRPSILCTNNTSEIDLVLGTESDFFQSKPSYANADRKKVFKEKASFSTVSVFGGWIKLGSWFLLLLLFLCFLYLRSGWKRDFSTLELSHFSVIFDCGSTGTRVHVYEWSHDKDKAQGSFPMLLHSRSEEPGENPAQLNEYPMLQTEPGLDKYLHNESGLRASIEPLLHWAQEVVPSYAHSRTRVFLLATAGLRRLPVSDVKWILDKLWTILLTSPFRCQRSWTRVISGVEEAYYGWVALNYEMNRLQNLPSQATFGAIDLGGSSVEVTFESGRENRGDNAMKVNIGLRERQLYAYSIPGYGLNDAFEKSVILLYRRFLENSTNHYPANYQLQLRHPCLHAGYRQSFYCSKCYHPHPDGSSGSGKRSTGNEFIVPVIELVGNPNWVKCQTLAKSTINSSLWSDSAIPMNCDLYPCALDKHQPQPRGRFFLLSGFFFVYRFFNLTSTATYEEILEKGQHHCLKTWQDASRSTVREPFIEQRCFHAPYMVALLRDGLHIRDTQITVGSGSLTWTLGAALLEAANLFPRNEALEGRHQPMPDKLSIGFFKLSKATCIILILILLTLGLFVVMARKVQNFKL